jgi:acetolactate synthase regulatory subunit
MSTQAGLAEPARNSEQNTEPFTACFSVVSGSDPNALSRILEPFTKRGLTPSHVYAMRGGEQGETLHVDLQLAGADADTAWRLANDLRGLWLVQTVLTSEKRTAERI